MFGVSISCLLTRVCGQAANRRAGKEQVVLSVCSSGSASVNIPLLSVSPSLPPSLPPYQLSRMQCFPPLHTLQSDTCLSLFVLKATDISFFHRHKAIFARSTGRDGVGVEGGGGVGESIKPEVLGTEDGEDGGRRVYSLYRREVFFLKHFTAS